MTNQKSTYEKNAQAVIDVENDHLKLSDHKAGIAFSGGGIRSASFGLGVMQGLVANKQLSKMDYMSTVSGGGFLGSALTWALKQGEGKSGTDPENFPIGSRGAASRSGRKGNELLDFIRQHGDYLTPTGSLGALSFAAVIFRSMLLSLFVYITFLTVVMGFLIWGQFVSDCPLTIPLWDQVFDYKVKGTIIPIGVLSFALFLLASLFYSLRTFLPSGSGLIGRYFGFIRGQKFAGYCWKAGLSCFLIGTFPYICGWLEIVESLIIASGSTVFGSLVGVWQYSKAQKGEQGGGALSDTTIYLGVFFLIYGLGLFAYLAANQVQALNDPFYWFILAGISALFGIIVNLNLIGPHRVWRDRIMEAYMPNKDAVTENEWQPATEADGALMKDMCDDKNPKPYHLVNTNLILADSPQSKYKGRGGDNFIISPLFCGSDATGWKDTPHFQTNMTTRGVTLATAIATSAAAVNPNAGVSGEGVTRNSMVSILLSLLNLRLGYWTTNPKKSPLPLPANFFFPGLSSEITPLKGLTENNTDIQLSDGGHFENLALYELIRRKLDLIVVSDGGYDPNFNFDDLGNAIERIRVDFGAKIKFLDEYGLDKILPGTAGNSEFDKQYDIRKHGFAIAEIEYSDYKQGDPKPLLVYVKLAMIEGLSTDVYSYKGVNPDFPHQSTADQFFDEKQFEAYRELGYHVAWQMMESKKGTHIFPRDKTNTKTA